MNNRFPVVLIVEDSPTQAAQIAAHLSRFDIQVIVAGNGAQGLRIVSIEKPDLIVLDVNMPTMNGYQMCQRIRRDPQTRNLPIIMLTTDDSLESIQKGMNVGADGYIIKGDQAITKLLSILRFYELLDPELV